MDYAGEPARHRAEHLSRSAAAAAHASYYAHPSLHLHTYTSGSRGKHAPAPNADLDIPGPGEIIGEMNGPASSSTSPPTAADLAPSGKKDPYNKEAEKKEERAPDEFVEGTKEEEGGKDGVGLPSGLDNGALEKGGEAGGTHTSPGPTAQEVHAALQKVSMDRNGVNGYGGMNGHSGLQEDLLERPGNQRHWNTTGIMQPHIQMMCGPLLSYYTVENDVWYGAALVVAADAGSDYSQNPFLTLNFHTYSPPTTTDPTLTSPGALLPEKTFPSQKIFTYTSTQGSFSFWRFMLSIPLQSSEMTVSYSLNKGAPMDFVVPALGQNLRWAAHSCNGFSSGINPDEFKGDYQSGYDPVWEDMILNHHKIPYHCMVGGGDQIYCDAITREPELQGWINAPDRKSKLGTPLTDEIRNAVDRFYFNHYCKIFRSNAFGRANSTIPMVNMLDDHDLIDGFGTYDDETQAAPVMSYVGSRGYFWFLLFQLFVCDAVDGTDPAPRTHPVKSLIIGAPGAWIPFPGHSLVVYLGPKVLLLAIDCRAERKLNRICTTETYMKLFNEVKRYKGIEQLVILLGVPIAYPRMSFLEHFLDLKYNPLNILARHNALGLGGMVNKFNQASELLDDLNDHWCANTHKKERNWLVLECQKLAIEMHSRITFLSGDVHLAAVGCLFTKRKNGKAPLPEEDHRYMLNVVTSAIVNTPPPAGAARMVGMLSGNKHRTLHHDQTDEIMLPLFITDTDGKPMKKKFVQPRRNYTSVEYKPSGELVFDIRVEKTQGGGETMGYPVIAPAPRWT